MKILFVIAFLLLTAAGSYAQDFAVIINFKEGNTGIKTPEKVTNILIDTKDIFYDINYEGSSENAASGVKYKMKREDFESIKAAAYELLQNPADEVKLTRQDGSYTELNISIKTKEDKTDLKASGMTEEIKDNPVFLRLLSFKSEVENIIKHYVK